jgi:hypothetical protein
MTTAHAGAAAACEEAGRNVLESVAYATGIWWLLYASDAVAVSVSYHLTHILEEHDAAER